MAEIKLKVEHLSKTFEKKGRKGREVAALSDISLEVAKQEF